MGGASLWAVEAASPGTFDGLILFEPTCNLHEYQTAKMSINWLISTALSRESMEEAEAYFRSAKTFARWHPEALDAYIKSAVIETNSKTNAFEVKSAYTLACHPRYGGEYVVINKDDMCRVGCKVVFQYGSKTQMFSPEHHRHLLDRHFEVYSIGRQISKATHLLVVEGPDSASGRIVDALYDFPGFKSVHRRLSPKL